MANHKRSRGFTLIEMMVVSAIVAVIAAMAVQGYGGIAERTAPQNAAYDFSAALSKARARAAERNTNVFVVVFPKGGEGTGGGSSSTTTTTSTKSAGTDSSTTGNGAWAMVEDTNGSFYSRLGNLSSFDSLSGPEVLHRQQLADYAKQNVRFGTPNTGSTAEKELEMDSRLTGSTETQGGTATTSSSKKAMLISQMTSAEGCNFCSGSEQGRAGAIEFTPDGEARFWNAEGKQVHPDRAGMLMMVDRTGEKRAFVFGISPATSYVTFASN